MTGMKHKLPDFRSDREEEFWAARFIEWSLTPRLEKLIAEIRGLRGEMQQLVKRLEENIITSQRNEMQAEIRAVHTEVAATHMRIDGLKTEVNGRIDALKSEVNGRIDALNQRLDDPLNIRERLVAVEAKLAARSN